MMGSIEEGIFSDREKEVAEILLNLSTLITNSNNASIHHKIPASNLGDDDQINWDNWKALKPSTSSTCNKEVNFTLNYPRQTHQTLVRMANKIRFGNEGARLALPKGSLVERGKVKAEPTSVVMGSLPDEKPAKRKSLQQELKEEVDRLEKQRDALLKSRKKVRDHYNKKKAQNLQLIAHKQQLCSSKGKSMI